MASLRFRTGMLDRRRPVRRAACSGVLVGVIAGLLTGLTQAGWLVVLGASRAAAGAPALTDAAGAPLGLASTTAALWAAAGAGLGAVAGAILAAAEPTVEALARRRQRRPRAAATVHTLLVTPLLAMAWVELLGRAGAPGGLTGLLAGVGVLAAAFVGLWLLNEGAERIDRAARQGEGRTWPAWLAMIAAIVLAVGGKGLALRALAWPALVSLDAAGQVVRQGEALDPVVDLMIFGGWMLAVLAGVTATRAEPRRWAKLAAPKGALAVAIVAASLAALVLSGLRGSEGEARRGLLSASAPALAPVLDRFEP